MSTKTPIESLKDIEALEKVPLEERFTNWDAFDVVLGGTALDPDKVGLSYVIDGDPETPPLTYTYRELRARFIQAANLFRELGVGPGDAVCYLLPTMPEAYYVMVGAMAAGVSSCVNWMLEPPQIAQILTAAKAKVVVALGPTPGFEIWPKLEAIQGDIPGLEHIFSVQGPGGARLDESDFTLALDGRPGDVLAFASQSGRGDTVVYVHSGGTTGAPKLSRITNQGLVFKFWANAVIVDYTADDCILADYPLFHIAGFLGRGALAFANGMSVVIPSIMGARDKKFVANYWKFVERYRITAFSGVPTTLSVLVANPPDGEDVSSLAPFGTTGSAAFPMETAKKIEAQIGVRMLTTFGATEMTQNATQPPKDGDPRYGSTGIRLPYVEIRTVRRDRAGVILGDAESGEIGTILIRGPNVIPGYVDAALDEDVFLDGGWYNSGDLGRIDGDGYLWVTGREKDLIIRSGHNIDPSVIEQALAAHDAVQLCAAVSKPDAYAGELPMAYVQLRQGMNASEDELKEFVRTRITERAANPADIVVLDAMPLTDIGKARKDALRFDAAKKVFSELLAPLAEDGFEIAVEVGPHPVAGTMTTVTIAGDRGGETEARVHEILDPFTIAHEVVWG